MTDLNSKVALINGAGRGIGKAIAERFGALGASVVVNYSSSVEAAQETANVIERCGGKAIAVQADVSKVSDIDRLFQTSLERVENIHRRFPRDRRLAGRGFHWLRYTIDFRFH